jgi:hypothetical protein
MAVGQLREHVAATIAAERGLGAVEIDHRLSDLSQDGIERVAYELLGIHGAPFTLNRRT